MESFGIKKTLLLLVMFWNLENFYDTSTNGNSNYLEYTPKGSRHWTFSRFKKKADDIARTILLASQEDKEDYFHYPDIISFAEVENREVLNYLCRKTMLARLEYTIVHKDSPDPRGSDVALLYNSNSLQLLRTDFFPIIQNSGDTLKTREILHAEFVGKQRGDTIHILVNHWPSKRGGERASNQRRELASHTLNRLCDSLVRSNNRDKIIVCGDFNTQSPDIFLRDDTNVRETCFSQPNVCGTYKYNGNWETIDHFVTYLGNDADSLQCAARVFNHVFLLCSDKKYLGVKPRRTYSGPVYANGVSDHLPLLNFIYVLKTENNCSAN